MVSGAFGYDNYATQADTCHTYQLLLKGGINQRNLIVMLAQDMAYHPKNMEQGVIRHWDGGPDLYHGFHMNYVGESFTIENFEAIIMGDKNLVRGGSGRVLSTSPKVMIFFSSESHNRTTRTLQQQYIKVKEVLQSSRYSSTAMQYGAIQLANCTLSIFAASSLSTGTIAALALYETTKLESSYTSSKPSYYEPQTHSSSSSKHSCRYSSYATSSTSTSSRTSSSSVPPP